MDTFFTVISFICTILIILGIFLWFMGIIGVSWGWEDDHDIDECPACGAWLPEFNDPEQFDGAITRCKCGVDVVVHIDNGMATTSTQPRE